MITSRLNHHKKFQTKKGWNKKLRLKIGDRVRLQDAKLGTWLLKGTISELREADESSVKAGD